MTPTSPPAPARNPSPRDPWRDNARVLLIVLVVFGHCLEPLPDSHALATVYRFLYLFHIPAFAFLSGSVAHVDVDSRLLRGTAFRLLLPYLLFQALYAWAADVPGWPGDGPDGVATPYWLLWYLLSLAGWRLMLPLFSRLRQPLLVATGLALLAGCATDVGYYLSLSRTLVFFPLFLLGWRYGERWRDVSGTLAWRAWGVGILGGLLALCAVVAIDPRWLYGSLGYAALGATPLSGMGWRLLQLSANAAGCAAFLALVPRRHLRMSALGPGTLQTFLVHGFAVKLAIALGLFAWLDSQGPLTQTAWLLPASIACVIALGSPRSQWLLAPLTAPRWLEQLAWRGSRAAPAGSGRHRSQ